MADNAQAKKPSVFARMSRGFRDVRGEMKKVVWPSRKQALNNSVVVFVFMIIMAIVISLFDMGLSLLLGLLFGSPL